NCLRNISSLGRTPRLRGRFSGALTRENCSPRSLISFQGELHVMTTNRIMILGGGFGGIYTALRLEKLFARRTDTEISLVTRDNYFLFTPMLHEVAGNDLEETNIINPLRKLLGRVKTFVGTVQSIDLHRRTVHVSHGLEDHGHDLPFDHLVL